MIRGRAGVAVRLCTGGPGLGSAARRRAGRSWHPTAGQGSVPSPLRGFGRWPRAPSPAGPRRDLFWARNEEALHSPAKNRDLSQRRVTAFTLGGGRARGAPQAPFGGGRATPRTAGSARPGQSAPRGVALTASGPSHPARVGPRGDLGGAPAALPAPEPWGGAGGCRSAALTARGRQCHHLVAPAGPAGTARHGGPGPVSSQAGLRSPLRPRGSRTPEAPAGAQAGGTRVAEQPFIEGRGGTGPAVRAPGPAARLALPWGAAGSAHRRNNSELFPSAAPGVLPATPAVARGTFLPRSRCPWWLGRGTCPAPSAAEGELRRTRRSSASRSRRGSR